jgi:hypothetical protein
VQAAPGSKCKERRKMNGDSQGLGGSERERKESMRLNGDEEEKGEGEAPKLREEGRTLPVWLDPHSEGEQQLMLPLLLLVLPLLSEVQIGDEHC